MTLCTEAASTVARPSWIGEGPTHLSLSAPDQKRGLFPPIDRRGSAGRFQPAGGDLSDKVVPGRNFTARGTRGWR
jgi:hypothetical protein